MFQELLCYSISSLFLFKERETGKYNINDKVKDFILSNENE